jgi:glucokinase
MILAGDVGGTNTLLAWCEVSGSRVETAVVEVYASRKYGALEEAVTEFIEKHRGIARAAAFGVAGPVRHGRSKISNLSWEVDGKKLASLLALPRVEVAPFAL